MKTQEILDKLETEINPTGQLGLGIGTLAARLDFARKIGRNALRNLQTVYETIGNDTMAELVAQELKRFDDVLA